MVERASASTCHDLADVEARRAGDVRAAGGVGSRVRWRRQPGRVVPGPGEPVPDQERHIGESVMIGGYTTTVTDVQLDDGSIRVSIEITNRDEDPQRIDSTQWTLVNPRVQTIEATSADFTLTKLTGGETVTAKV